MPTMPNYFLIKLAFLSHPLIMSLAIFPIIFSKLKFVLTKFISGKIFLNLNLMKKLNSNLWLPLMKTKLEFFHPLNGDQKFMSTYPEASQKTSLYIEMCLRLS